MRFIIELNPDKFEVWIYLEYRAWVIHEGVLFHHCLRPICPIGADVRQYLEPDEPDPPLDQAADCSNLYDDGQSHSRH